MTHFQPPKLESNKIGADHSGQLRCPSCLASGDGRIKVHRGLIVLFTLVSAVFSEEPQRYLLPEQFYWRYSEEGEPEAYYGHDGIFVILEKDGLKFEGRELPAVRTTEHLNGLLQYHRLEKVYLFLREGLSFGEVVGSVDLLRTTDAKRVVIVATELPPGIIYEGISPSSRRSQRGADAPRG